MKKVFARLALALMLAGAGAPSSAHRFHAGITDIAVNQASGGIEIVHTYMAHDIDALLALLHKRQIDLTQPADEALLRQYVEQRFFLLAPDKTRLPLKWIGISVNVESVVIYQELEDTPLAQVAQVHNEVLLDFLPRQVNTLNVRRDGELRSLTFNRKSARHSLR